MRFLVTAGPTREYIDDVRFLSNASSGRMGVAIAGVLAKRHEVTLVAGPIAVEIPRGVECVSVTSAREMRREVMARFAECECVIMTAAVADYRPERKVRGKMRKGSDALELLLAPNPDILLELGKKKGERVLIGFALESSAGALARARRKMRRKNLDAIVLNTTETMGSDAVSGTLLAQGRADEAFGPVKKEALGRRLEKLAVELMKGKP